MTLENVNSLMQSDVVEQPLHAVEAATKKRFERASYFCRTVYYHAALLLTALCALPVRLSLLLSSTGS